MDLCAESLCRELPTSDTLVERFVPHFSSPISRLFRGRLKSVAFNAERLLNRFIVYPRSVKRFIDGKQGPAQKNRVAGSRSQLSDSDTRFDVFHIVDHTYSQLVHAMPAGRSGVYCHDLDAYRSILEPSQEPRPWWYRQMATRQLSGLKRASVVFHSTALFRAKILEHGIVHEKKLVQAPYGVSEEFHAAGKTLSEPQPDAPWILHVGSAIPRKRVDILLKSFAFARRSIPNLRLVKVGGDWAQEHRQIIEQGNLLSAIDHPTDLSRTELAKLYRDASLVLVPSEAEGFGLPVIEALACGSRVLCSDLPVLREVAGNSANYAPVGDEQVWGNAILSILNGTMTVADRDDRIAWAQRYSWANHARIIRNAYRELAERTMRSLE